MKKVFLFLLMSIFSFSYGQKSDINELIFNYNNYECWLLKDSISKLTFDIKNLNDSIIKLNKEILLEKNKNNDEIIKLLIIVSAIVIILFIFLIIAFNKSAQKELDIN